MAVRYFRNASNVLVERTEIDSETPGTGLTAVRKTEIEAVYTGVILLGGTFDGADYTLPAGQAVVYDLSTNDGMLRATVRGTHEQLNVWREALIREGVAHDSDDVNLGLTYLARAHEWNYLVAHNHRISGNADWPLAQRIAAIQQLAFGASNVTSPFEFFMRLQATNGGLIAKPPGPCGWVNVDTGARVELHQAVGITGTMNLDVTQLPNSSIVSGVWIDTLTA